MSKNKKLKLTYIRYAGAGCIQHPHYDLHTDEKEPLNIACILSSDIKIVKKMVKLYNKEIGNEKYRKIC